MFEISDDDELFNEDFTSDTTDHLCGVEDSKLFVSRSTDAGICKISPLRLFKAESMIEDSHQDFHVDYMCAKRPRTLFEKSEKSDVLRTAVTLPLLSSSKYRPVLPQQLQNQKFPGPAGLLHPLNCPVFDLKNTSAISQGTFFVNDAIFKSQVRRILGNDQILAQSPHMRAQPCGSAAWQALLCDLEPHATYALRMFCVKTMLYKASRRTLLNGKIPMLFTILESIDQRGMDAAVVLGDNTGFVPGTVHRDVLKDFSSLLQAGAAIVLRQVTVVSPSLRCHYLNITLRNVVAIYPVGGGGQGIACDMDYVFGKKLSSPEKLHNLIKAAEIQCNADTHSAYGDSNNRYPSSMHMSHNVEASPASQFCQASVYSVLSPLLCMSSPTAFPLPNSVTCVECDIHDDSSWRTPTGTSSVLQTSRYNEISTITLHAPSYSNSRPEATCHAPRFSNYRPFDTSHASSHFNNCLPSVTSATHCFSSGAHCKSHTLSYSTCLMSVAQHRPDCHNDDSQRLCSADQMTSASTYTPGYCPPASSAPLFYQKPSASFCTPAVGIGSRTSVPDLSGGGNNSGADVSELDISLSNFQSDSQIPNDFEVCSIFYDSFVYVDCPSSQLIVPHSINHIFTSNAQHTNMTFSKSDGTFSKACSGQIFSQSDSASSTALGLCSMADDSNVSSTINDMLSCVISADLPFRFSTGIMVNPSVNKSDFAIGNCNVALKMFEDEIGDDILSQISDEF